MWISSRSIFPRTSNGVPGIGTGTSTDQGAVESEADGRVVSEAADVLFHVMVALRSRDLGIDAVLQELERRAGTGGHEEKNRRKPKGVV